jgi:hypothetical protein
MLAHVQGPKMALVNDFAGPWPHHLVASLEGDHVAVVISHQNRTVKRQIDRGVRTAGYRFSKDLAEPLARSCPAYAKLDETTIATMEDIHADGVLTLCENPGSEALAPELANALAAGLRLASRRVGHVDEPLRVALTVPGASGDATLYQLDAYHNLASWALRNLDAGWDVSGLDTNTGDRTEMNALAQRMWTEMKQPLRTLTIVEAQLSLDVPAESVVLVLIPLSRDAQSLSSPR